MNQETMPFAGETRAADRAHLVPVDRLYRRTDPSILNFSTTDDLQPLDELNTQHRAMDAIRLGAQLDRPGFAIFAIGRGESRMTESVRQVLAEVAPRKPKPQDWIYVNNFADGRKPVAISLPPGRAVAFQAAMADLIEDLKTALPALFESEEYQAKRASLEDSFRKRQSDAFAAVQAKANDHNIAVVRTPMGFALVPSKDGEPLPPDELKTWPEERRRELQRAMEELEGELERVIRQVPQSDKERRLAVRELNRQTAQRAVESLIDEKKREFHDVERVVAHLGRVQADIVENVGIFIGNPHEGMPAMDETAIPAEPFDRYGVNVLVSQSDGPGAPIVEELHPTLANLLGSIEHVARQGVLVTNFRLIKAGAIHRANGGYLLLDARNLLTEPLSWPALKRTLRRGEIVIEDVGRLLGFSSTVSLEPDPIPLAVKVVLIGDRLLYFLLTAIDPDLGEHFKILADFDDDTSRSPASELVLARLIAAMARSEKLAPLDHEAAGLLIEHAARLADDAAKLTMLVDRVRDTLVEADYWRGAADRPVTTAADVEKAIEERTRRASRLRDRMQEMITNRVALIETGGSRTGQINGLSVIEIGGHAFGRPTRISCQVRPGSGRVIDIEREVELGGPLHSKGVLILSGFLAGRYALDTPMSLQASLVFEQSYGGVEGDSASSAELYVLISALAGVPLRQDLAVTGSVNQHGEIQAIGGVNEKIEGFFDLCRAVGLTGTQGVLIPRSNVQHLMLRQDVREACEAGKFAVYGISTIDEGLGLMTGREPGTRGPDGGYAAGSINRLAEDRLRSFAAVRRNFAAEVGGASARPGS